MTATNDEEQYATGELCSVGVPYCDCGLWPVAVQHQAHTEEGA